MNTPASSEYISRDKVDEQRSDFRSFLYLLRFARPDLSAILLSLTLLTLGALSSVAAARVLGQLVQKGFVARDLQAAKVWGSWVLAFEASAIIAAYLGRRRLVAASSRTILRIRETLFAQIHRLPLSYYDRQPLGRVVTRLSNDVEGLEEFFGHTLARLLNAGLTLSIVTCAMLFTDLKLGALLSLCILPAIVLTWAARTRARYWNREMARRSAAINAQMAELLGGMSVVRGFGLEDWTRTRFTAYVERYLISALSLNRLNSMIRPGVSFLCLLPLFILLWVGGRAVLAGLLPLGTLVALSRLCERFARPVDSLAQEIHVVQTAFTSADRIAAFLQEPTEEIVLGTDGKRSASQLQGAIEFKNVAMGYSAEHPVLRDVSFSIPAGARVGLAGRTGSGKTTIVSLLARLYEFQLGEILMDGVPLRDYARESLREQLGFVSQEVVIFKGSMRENLACGGSFSDDQILNACKETGLNRVFLRTGLSLNSELLDKGANLSVGERQLVALTRVLLKNPRILILDEATANIDPYYETLIHEGVDRVMQGRTCLLIAHRLSTLAGCDFILLFRNGELVEQGSHEELLAKRGYYQRLVAGREFSGSGLDH